MSAPFQYVLLGAVALCVLVIVFRIARILLGDMPLSGTEADSSNAETV